VKLFAGVRSECPKPARGTSASGSSAPARVCAAGIDEVGAEDWAHLEDLMATFNKSRSQACSQQHLRQQHSRLDDQARTRSDQVQDGNADA
jgi:hypothetical protein